MRIDKDWIPQGKGYSLYIRPTCIATDAFLGVHPSKTCKVYTICSPSGPYYATGFKPIKLVADEDHVRAWPGGHGAYKLGANYAPTILPAHDWEKKGYSQLLGVGPDGIIMEERVQGEREGVHHPRHREGCCRASSPGVLHVWHCGSLRLHQRHPVQGQDDRHPTRPEGPVEACGPHHATRLRRADGHPARCVAESLP